jgi:predicted nucleic acid-binding protein
MSRANGWFTCRVAYVETTRAVALAAGAVAARAFRADWPALGVIEVDQALAESAAELAVAHSLRSLDALHLAAALVLPRDDLALMTWDRRLHAAAGAKSIAALPDEL